MCLDYCGWLLYQILTKPILFWDITTNIKCKKNISITNQIWHRTKWYFTCISNKRYLITVPNMNKITTLLSEISQQKLKYYEKIAIISQSWHRSKFYSPCISGPWYLIMVPNMKKIYSAIMEECVRTDWWSGPFSIYCSSWILSLQVSTCAIHTCSIELT